jgi:hypothetical protein
MRHTVHNARYAELDGGSGAESPVRTVNGETDYEVVCYVYIVRL